MAQFLPFPEPMDQSPTCLLYACLLSSSFAKHSIIDLAPVAQKVDNTIHWIVIYPADSAIHCLNNWGMRFSNATFLALTSYLYNGLIGLSVLIVH